jgi:carbonic anhydrase
MPSTRLPIKLFASLALCLAGLSSAAATDKLHWQYSGDQGPEHWAQMRPDYALCGRGQRQSPIDITSASIKPNQTAKPLQFDYRSAPASIVNDGHTVRVRIAKGSQLTIGTEHLSLQQFHFHTPGGDRLQGEEFPLAMHFLHKSRSGQLVSLVLLFRQGAENKTLAGLLPQMPTRGDKAEHKLPAERGYYSYAGSLTAPPCTEGVLWLVLKQPLQLSSAQLASLHQLFPDNARPVQALHGRSVSEGR